VRTAGRADAAEGRRGRLRLLTGATVAAWLAALVITGVPALAGGSGSGTGGSADAPAGPRASASVAGSPAPTVTPERKAKPSDAPRRTAKPGPTPKASPRSTPTPTPDAGPTPTPEPTATPRATHKPRPTPAASDGGGTGGAGKSNGQGAGGAPGPGASSAPTTKGGGGNGSGKPADVQAPGQDVFGVPGAGSLLAADRASERAAGEGSDALDTEIYLDVRFASSPDLLAPAALLALPLLLIVLSVAAQIAGGLLWIPMTNRVLGNRASQR
jgi:hypothetical protein